MATIGLDKLYYAKITEAENGEETYDKPVQLAKAMSADLSVELAEATLYADDGAAEIVKEFKSGKLTLGVDDIGSTVASDLSGATIDANGVIVSASEDGGTPVAVGFRAKKSNGKYRYFWLYRVKFASPQRTWPPRVTALPSPLPPSKVPSCAVTSPIPVASIPGRQRSRRAILLSPRKPSSTGITRFTNPHIPPDKEELWILNALQTSPLAVRNIPWF